MMPRSTTQEKLAEQLSFLNNSLEAYKNGNHAESLRIATTIRVLVHEPKTKSSVPLLKQVDPNYLDLTILDKPDTTSPKTMQFIGIGVSVKADQLGVGHPVTDLTDPGLQPMPLKHWWHRPLLIFRQNGHQVRFTRRDLLLTLADKEGGAHVDSTVPPDYEKYVVDSAIPFIVNNVMTDSAHLAQFASVEAGVRMIECLERTFPWLKP
jgi:hypothetical protein